VQKFFTHLIVFAQKQIPAPNHPGVLGKPGYSLPSVLRRTGQLLNAYGQQLSKYGSGNGKRVGNFHKWFIISNLCLDGAIGIAALSQLMGRPAILGRA